MTQQARGPEGESAAEAHRVHPVERGIGEPAEAPLDRAWLGNGRGGSSRTFIGHSLEASRGCDASA